jgi:hypothetical protein
MNALLKAFLVSDAEAYNSQDWCLTTNPFCSKYPTKSLPIMEWESMWGITGADAVDIIQIPGMNVITAEISARA